jgi:hypothetical protein
MRGHNPRRRRVSEGVEKAGDTIHAAGVRGGFPSSPPGRGGRGSLVLRDPLQNVTPASSFTASKGERRRMGCAVSWSSRCPNPIISSRSSKRKPRSSSLFSSGLTKSAWGSISKIPSGFAKSPGTIWAARSRRPTRRRSSARSNSIRRSRRLESGWEIDNDRLFLAPNLFDELLLVQYPVSRSHKAGGLTLEGRCALRELFARLRRGGFLRALDTNAQNPADALEQLVTYLGGGESVIKFYHIVDRRDFLEKLKGLKLVRPPKPKER